jgi:hypothetical protein
VHYGYLKKLNSNVHWKSFGVGGGGEMIKTLRIERDRWGIFYPCFSKFCIFGQWLLFLLCRLVIVTFLFVSLPLVRCLLLYTSYVIMGAIRFF